MTEKKSSFEETKIPLQETVTNSSRRKFLTYAGLSATLLAASCRKETLQDILDGNNPFHGPKNAVDLGSGDIGILNYAYALEQLEAAFYTMVTKSFYPGATDKERRYLEDIRDHEIAHREFFKNALGSSAIGALEVNFSSINFNSRDSVLGTARAFEDLGVSAYNGAGELLKSANYLLLAGKIVSVEARHAAAIRDLISYGSFADNTVVNQMGLDVYRKPPEVLKIASAYITTPINANNLPTS
jgi:hypothetical protein